MLGLPTEPTYLGIHTRATDVAIASISKTTGESRPWIQRISCSQFGSVI